jgi:hypothetical protein
MVGRRMDRPMEACIEHVESVIFVLPEGRTPTVASKLVLE